MTNIALPYNIILIYRLDLVKVQGHASNQCARGYIVIFSEHISIDTHVHY